MNCRVNFVRFCGCVLIVVMLFIVACSKDSTAPQPEKVRRQVVFFASDRNGGNMNIWRMEVDGSNPQQVTFYPNGDFYPADIAIDGKTLLYYRYDRYTLIAGVYILNLLESPPSIDEAIISNLIIPGNFYPNGEDFVYYQWTRFNDSLKHDVIYKYNLLSHNTAQLSEKGIPAGLPVVSPDGQKIAYSEQNVGIGNLRIVLRNSDSSEKIFLTEENPGLAAYNGRFSRDGGKLFFTMNERLGSIYELHYVDMSDYSIQYVPYLPIDNYRDIKEPCPDTSGSRVFFRSIVYNIPNPDSTSEIIAVNTDGSGSKRLTNNIYWDSKPVVGVAEFWE